MARANVSAARSFSLTIISFISLCLLLAFADYALAQQTQGDRLTDFDIDPLPGDGKQDARGVCSDGTTLWVVEEQKSTLLAYTLDDNVPTRNEARDIRIDFGSSSPQKDPAGCTVVGATLYVADDGKDKLIAYETASGDRVPEKDFNTLSGAQNNHPRGVTSDGTTMWVSDSGLKKLFAYRLADNAHHADKDIPLHSQDVLPQGIWTDGTTIWVADSKGAHFYAYDLSTKQRDEEKEFAATDITTVQGIWSNGSVLWAVNRAKKQETGNKVLAYRMPVSLSSDASLSALALSDVTLSPTFETGKMAYTASVGNAVTQTTVTAMASHSEATVVITPSDADTGTDGHQVDLAVGSTAVSVTVTAEDGETTQTYAVTVTRAKSQDASLSALTLSGVTLSPVFEAGTTAYTASVGNTVAQTTVTQYQQTAQLGSQG